MQEQDKPQQQQTPLRLRQHEITGMLKLKNSAVIPFVLISAGEIGSFLSTNSVSVGSGWMTFFFSFLRVLVHVVRRKRVNPTSR